ncbi:hypothetical protein HAX54_005169 [Datura stramonium]|uniref:Cytochrome P450 n=1 Tax=Datura stramonium TaxID=4076 RepID=A0ABS8T9V8_DATST|nr:hypothetical protein [Datura stramonium]
MNATLDSIVRVGCCIELDSISGSNEEGKKFSNAFDNQAKIQRQLPFLGLIYVLCKYPHVQEKVVQEIKKSATEKEYDATDITNITATVSAVTLEKMQYLHAALIETLRLYPAVPVDGKISFLDDALPDGFSVNKGDMVCYQPYAIGRMRFICGDDAEEYKPERRLDGNGLFRQERPFILAAFQDRLPAWGSSLLTGRLKIFSAVLLHYFVFKSSDDKKTVNDRTTINLT